MTKGRFSGSTVKEGVWPRRSWVLGSLLGAGACAEVYEASPTLPLDHQHDKGMQWVAKVSPLPPPEAPKKGKKRSSEELSADVLHMEHSLYRNKLSTHPGVPRMPYHGGYGDDASVGVRFIVSALRPKDGVHFIFVFVLGAALTPSAALCRLWRSWALLSAVSRKKKGAFRLPLPRSTGGR
jgi:hypothetical protein